MADVNALLQKILSDPKMTSSVNFASRVYSDEPILMTAPRMARFTPPKIREMRRMARGAGLDAKVFYEQGVFMASFEDDFDYRGEFAHYFPTYQHMTDVQLRGYFSWRTKVRRGVFEKTSLSFAFVYIYELLNGIGVSSALDGFHALKNFRDAYGEIEPRINGYVDLWLKDCVVYNNLDKSLLDGLPDLTFDKAVTVLLEYGSHGAEEVFSALNAISSYNLEESRFFKNHPDDVRDVVSRVFSVVSEYHNRKPEKGAREKLFGRVCASHYTMFRSAVFHHRGARESRAYEIGGHHKYICADGLWSCERFLWYGKNNRQIGALLKTVDFLMRREYGFNSTLRAGKTNKILTGKIEKEIAKYLEEKRKSAPPEIDIDVSRLQGIRAAALATQERLLVGEPEGHDEPPEPVEEESEPPENAPALSDAERRFVRCLLNGRPYEELIRSKGVMLSVLVDGVNAKLFEAFGDTVIVEDGGAPVLLEEYREELKGIVAT